MTRKKHRSFQRPVALGKFIHNSNVSGSEFLRASYHCRVCRVWHKTREVKVLLPGNRRAEGQEKGKVSIARCWLEPNPKLRGDEQEPDKRCDVSETSGHLTTKSSICKRDTFYKFGVYATKVRRQTSTGLEYGQIGARPVAVE